MTRLARSTSGGRSTSPAGRGGADAAQEAQLVDIHVAEPGQVALLAQRDRDRHVGCDGDASHRLVGVPVGAEQVGSEVVEPVGLLGCREHLDHAEVEADGHGGRRLDHDPGLPAGPAPPLPRPVHPPLPLHLEVRVQHEVADAHQQVLAPAPHRVHRLAGEVDGRVRGDPQVARGDDLPGERRIEPACGLVDGVTFWHRTAAPSASRGSRPRAAAGRARSRTPPARSRSRSAAWASRLARAPRPARPRRR